MPVSLGKLVVQQIDNQNPFKIEDQNLVTTQISWLIFLILPIPSGSTLLYSLPAVPLPSLLSLTQVYHALSSSPHFCSCYFLFLGFSVTKIWFESCLDLLVAERSISYFYQKNRSQNRTYLQIKWLKYLKCLVPDTHIVNIQ